MMKMVVLNSYKEQQKERECKHSPNERENNLIKSRAMHSYLIIEGQALSVTTLIMNEVVRLSPSSPCQRREQILFITEGEI